jgi:hypothetical protein
MQALILARLLGQHYQHGRYQCMAIFSIESIFGTNLVFHAFVVIGFECVCYFTTTTSM